MSTKICLRDNNIDICPQSNPQFTSHREHLYLVSMPKVVRSLLKKHCSDDTDVDTVRHFLIRMINITSVLLHLMVTASFVIGKLLVCFLVWQ